MKRKKKSIFYFNDLYFFKYTFQKKNLYYFLYFIKIILFTYLILSLSLSLSLNILATYLFSQKLSTWSINLLIFPQNHPITAQNLNLRNANNNLAHYLDPQIKFYGLIAF